MLSRCCKSTPVVDALTPRLAYLLMAMAVKETPITIQDVYFSTVMKYSDMSYFFYSLEVEIS